MSIYRLTSLVCMSTWSFSGCQPLTSKNEAICAMQAGVDSPEAMEAALNFILKWGSLLAIVLIPIWPLLTLPAGVFNEGMSPGNSAPPSHIL